MAAIIRAIQYSHLQSKLAVKPEMIGPIAGPTFKHFTLVSRSYMITGLDYHLLS